MENLFNFIVLVVIAYLVYRLFRHFVPPTPPAAAGANTPPPVPVNWNDRIGNALKVVAIIAIIWLLFTGRLIGLFTGDSSNSSETTQSVDVRDNYGTIQQNDVKVTNNHVIVQTIEKVRTVQVVDGDVTVQSGKKSGGIKTVKKRYVDTNDDPPVVDMSASSGVTDLLR